jgi:hypothetical protein
LLWRLRLADNALLAISIQDAFNQVLGFKSRASGSCDPWASRSFLHWERSRDGAAIGGTVPGNAFAFIVQFVKILNFVFSFGLGATCSASRQSGASLSRRLLLSSEASIHAVSQLALVFSRFF